MRDRTRQALLVAIENQLLMVPGAIVAMIWANTDSIAVCDRRRALAAINQRDVSELTAGQPFGEPKKQQ